MKPLHLLTMVVCCLAAFTAHGRGNPGGSSGGGGETADTAGGAWFTVRRPIWYCIERDPGFGISEAEADQHFQAAVKTWADYLKDRSVGLHARFTKAPCDGRQDMVLYLGKDAAEVTAAKKKYVAPVALTERTAYDYEDGWGKGFLWVANSKAVLSDTTTAGDWSKGKKLQILFTHEIGHTLGCDHVDGTIMDEDIPRYVADGPLGTSIPDERLATIDQSRELKPELNGITTYSGGLGRTYPYWQKPASGPESFELIAGRKPAGAVKGTLAVGRYGKQFVELKDDQGTLHLDLTTKDQTFFQLGTVFRITKSGHHGSENMLARTMEGTATSSAGTQYPFQLIQNSSYGPAVLALVVNGKKYPLFSADQP